MCLLALGALLLAAQDAPCDVLIGTLERDPDTREYSVDGTRLSIPAAVLVGGTLVGKRVQVVGTRGRDETSLTVSRVDELEPPEKDLVLAVSAAAEWGEAEEEDRIAVELMEYTVNRQHKHRRTCKSHAWTRARLEGEAGKTVAAGELRVPACKGGSQAKVFVRVTAPRCLAASGRDFTWSGKAWLDDNLHEVESPLKIELTVKAP